MSGLFSRMMSRTRRSGAGRQVATAPEGKRLYAIGDIHGRKDLLEALHGLIEQDIAAHPDKTPVLVYLGDYVDRGPDSRGVIEALAGINPPGVERTFLLGNHEDAMLAFLRDPESAAPWLEVGGLQTLASYGVDAGPPSSPDDLADMATSLAEALPDHHRAFLDGLSLWKVQGDYLFVHAGIRPGTPIARQAVEDVLYIREPFLSATEPHDYVIVHGHHVSDQPVARPNRIGIDTGAFATGCLTCLILDGTSRTFFST